MPKNVIAWSPPIIARRKPFMTGAGLRLCSDASSTGYASNVTETDRNEHGPHEQGALESENPDEREERLNRDTTGSGSTTTGAAIFEVAGPALILNAHGRLAVAVAWPTLTFYAATR